MRLHLSSRTSLVAICLALAKFVVAECECGYSLNKTSDANHQVYTELLESDFTTLKDIHKDRDWVVQEWEIGKAASKGPYGRKVERKNAISNPAKDLKASAEGKNGPEAGLELWVRALESPDQEMVSVVEVDSNRTDMQYGTFRAGIKQTGINGTCGAFFWYLNDTQEIDMEFLSSQLNDSTSPVNLVLHSTVSQSAGGDASGTPAFRVIELPFESDLDVHEYRFDWSPDKVSFYADGKWLLDMTDKNYIPSAAGKIVISQWSNGHDKWSGGPPEVDAKMLVTYVKAYFNSTDEAKNEAHAERCKDVNAPGAICQIPDQLVAPSYGPLATAEQKPYFFTLDPAKGKAPGHVTQGEIELGIKNDAFSILRGGVSGTVVISLIVGLMVGL